MKPSFIRTLTLSTALSLGLSAGVNAAQYNSLDTQASNISFGYSQMGVSMEGGFNEFDVKEFNFDPASPETAQVAIAIPLKTIDAGYVDANNELVKEEWLNMETHPLAAFKSSSVESLGDNQYQVTGVLAIKGHEQEVSAPFTFSEDGDKGVFEGNFTFQRNDFAIGEGSWSDTTIVANDIEIKFHFVANS